MEIQYIERKTGETCVEKIYGHKALSWLYGDGFFKRLFSFCILPLLVHFPFSSWLYGLLQKRAGSAKKIVSFIQTYGIDASEFAPAQFRSFNDFFIRKLRAETRPIVSDPSVLVMPADGRYFVYPHFNQFLVKGKEFSLTQFLGNVALAGRYKQGSMAIIRLCPTDYHRFHFPCDGIPYKPRLINGPLYSVNPLALRRRMAILAENKRMITEIETERFGTILYVEIGATSVGSIRQTFQAEQPVCKGDEKGYFEFGGSCLVLLFEPNCITFDADLVAHTKIGLETRSNFGQSLGRAN